MERGNRGKRILSAVMLLVLVTALSCYAAGRSGNEAPDEKMAVSGMEVAGAETDLALVESGEDSPKMEEQDIREMEEEEFQEKEATEEEEPVFGRGMESEESLVEWVVTAMKSLGSAEKTVAAPRNRCMDILRSICLREKGIDSAGFRLLASRNRFWESVLGRHRHPCL